MRNSVILAIINWFGKTVGRKDIQDRISQHHWNFLLFFSSFVSIYLWLSTQLLGISGL